MFNNKTVLILGAGASRDFGFPVGEELIGNIIDHIKSMKTGRRIHAQKLSEMPQFYDPLSIDSFLSQNRADKSMVNEGKFWIAYDILSREQESHLGRRDIERGMRHPNWYRYLFNSVTEGVTPQELIEKPLNLDIITFNYDCSLDYFLYSRVFKSAFLNSDQKSLLLEKIKESIIHIYGHVYPYQWQGGKRENEDYGNWEVDSLYLAANDCLKNIFVVGEDRKNIAENVKKAKERIDGASKVFILGYGFNDENNELLELKNLTKNVGVICISTKGESGILESKIRQSCGMIRDMARSSEGLVISKIGVYDSLTSDFRLN